ncbi:hypothetical protein DFP73DRAFT_78741 [Morchella snyderi]|nr:hypothetical protein DFP73DRAFT_78741 [Morchella snyderi]
MYSYAVQQLLAGRGKRRTEPLQGGVVEYHQPKGRRRTRGLGGEKLPVSCVVYVAPLLVSSGLVSSRLVWSLLVWSLLVSSLLVWSLLCSALLCSVGQGWMYG